MQDRGSGGRARFRHSRRRLAAAAGAKLPLYRGLVATLFALAAFTALTSVGYSGLSASSEYGYGYGYGYGYEYNSPPFCSPPSDQSSDEGTSHSFALGSFGDVDGNGPWQIVVTWGDASAPETFSRSSTGVIPPRAHTYDDNGTFTVTVTITDADGASDTCTFHVAVANVAPSATFNAQSPVDEGSSFQLSLTNPSDPSNADTAAGFTYAFDCGDGSGFGPFSPSNSRTCPTDDNGTRAVGGKIRDKDGGTTTYTGTVQVNNVPPTCGPIVPVPPVAAVGTPVTAGAPFTDPGTADTHTAVMDWGDGTTSPGTVTEASGSGTVTATHTYTSAGFFTLTLTVTDDDGGSGQCTFEFVLVFDVSAGGNFVIGDLNSAVGSAVTFWGAQWSKLNSLSGGPAPLSFKGFEDTPSTLPACGTGWSTDPGNSSGPPSSIPALMAVLVSSSISKAGSTISGDTPHIVVVQTNPGYAPDPGHAGTGTVVGVVC